MTKESYNSSEINNEDINLFKNNNTENIDTITVPISKNITEIKDSSNTESNENFIEVFSQTDKETDCNIIKNLKFKLNQFIEENILLKKTIQDLKDENSFLNKKRNNSTELSITDNSSVTPENDPFILLKSLIQLFERIKKKLSCFINQYQTKINLNEQDKDDIIFYNSIIIDCKNYYVASHLVRERKLIYDLNKLLKLFGKSFGKTFDNSIGKKIYKINFDTLDMIKNSYYQIEKKANMKNLEDNKPVWIKKDNLKQINILKKEMIKMFNYHIYVNDFFLDSLENELFFFSIK